MLSNMKLFDPSDPPLEFTKENIDAAPIALGVFILYREDEIIYIGTSAGGIRKGLLNSFNGTYGVCAHSATHFRWEITDKVVAIKDQLLDDYKKQHDGIEPPCNVNREHIFIDDTSFTDPT